MRASVLYFGEGKPASCRYQYVVYCVENYFGLAVENSEYLIEDFAQLAPLTGCSAVHPVSRAIALFSPLRYRNNLISRSFKVPPQCE